MSSIVSCVVTVSVNVLLIMKLLPVNITFTAVTTAVIYISILDD